MLFHSNSADSDTARVMATTRTAWHFAGDAAGMPVWKQALTGAARSNRLLVKLCTGLSLLLILFTWFDISAILKNLFAIDARFMLLAMGIFVLQFALSCVRWVYILGRQHLSIGSRSALSIYGTGTLANLFLVTSIAGMSVRAALLVRKGTGLSGALASLIVERIAAMAGLGICGVAGLVFIFPELQRFLGEWSLLGTTGLVAAGLVILGGSTFLIFWKFKGLRSFALKVWMAFSSPRQALLLIVLSALVVLLGFAGMAALAFGMGLSIDPVFFVSVMPAIALISALPISVGGWGVREGAMVAGLSIFSVPADTALALSISYGLGGLLVALLLGAVLSLIGQESLKANKQPESGR
jgi:uncharacterized membrane protein YbhN (UPF0104 family)